MHIEKIQDFQSLLFKILESKLNKKGLILIEKRIVYFVVYVLDMC